MQIPEILLKKYQNIRRLAIDSAKGHQFYSATNRSNATFPTHFIKSVPFSESTHKRLTDLLDRQSENSILNVPSEIEHIQNKIWIISKFIVGQSLAEFGPTNVETHQHPQNSRQLVECCKDILCALERNRIIHFDLKPNNLMVIADRNIIERIVVIDFDSAITTGQRGHPHFTPAYSSPEKINPDISLTLKDNSWAIGIILFEWLSGTRVFRNVSSTSIIESLASSWQPAFERIVQDNYRAIISGLCIRDANIRFTYQHIADWLNGNNDIVVKGLALSGLNVPQNPFHINNVDCFTLQALSSQLLYVPRHNIINNENLISWLQNEVPGGQSLAERVAALTDNSEFEESRLSLCFELWPHLPLVWLQERLTTNNIYAICLRALDGASTGAEQAFLETLITEDPYRFYESRERSDITALKRDIFHNYLMYIESRNEIIITGNLEQLYDTPVAEIIFALLNEERANEIIEESLSWFAPSAFLHRHSWFFTFGAEGHTLPQILALREAEPQSRQGTQVLRNVEDLEALASGDFLQISVIEETQNKLLQSLKVLPNTRIASCVAPDNILVGPTGSGTYSLRNVFFAFDSFHQLNQMLKRRFNSLRAIFRFRRNDTNSQLEVPEINLRIDYVPLAHKENVLDENLPCGIFLKITWLSAQGDRVKIKAVHPNLLHPKALLRMTKLPHKGSISHVLLNNAIIKLTAKSSFFSRARHAQISINTNYFRPNPNLTKSLEHITKPSPLISTNSIGLSPPSKMVSSNNCESVDLNVDQLARSNVIIQKHLPVTPDSQADSIKAIWLPFNVEMQIFTTRVQNKVSRIINRLRIFFKRD